jgi:ribonuclease BN (tRNA processing enzyme)
VQVMPFPVRHPSGAPSFALRCEIDGNTLCYSGDTEWVEALVHAAQNADLFVAESYTFERSVPFHTSWLTLRDHLPEINAKRILLTHMSTEMLEHKPVQGAEFAEDGMVLEI